MVLINHMYRYWTLFFPDSGATKVQDERMQECNPQEADVDMEVTMEVRDNDVNMQEIDHDEEWWSKYGHEVIEIVDNITALKWSHYNPSTWHTEFYFDVII